MTVSAKSLANLKSWKKGESGNAGGKTSAQRKAEVEASELAAIVSLKMVKAVHKAVKNEDDVDAVLNNIRGDVLTLLRNVQDRAHGSPKQTVDQTTTHNNVPKGNDAFYASQNDTPEPVDGE